MSNPATALDLRQGQARFRRDMARDYLDESRVLIRSYRRQSNVLRGLIREIEATLRNRALTNAELANLQTLRDLQTETRAALRDMAGQVAISAGRLERGALARTPDMVARSLKAVGVADFNRPSVSAIAELVNITESAAYRDSLSQFADYHADKIPAIVQSMASMGRSPMATMSYIKKYLLNVSPYARGGVVADMLRNVRTVQLYAARRGTQEIYKQNREIVLGWWWSSALDARTCPACIANHGNKFDVDQGLNDHFNGRCAMVPITRLTVNDPVQTGEEWLKEQPKNLQKTIMGKARWQAWQDGEFKLADVIDSYEHTLYGTMYHAASLKQIRATALERTMAPSRYRPMPTEITAPDTQFWDMARQVTAEGLENGEHDLTPEIEDLFWGYFSYDESGAAYFSRTELEKGTNGLFTSIWEFGNATPRPGEIDDIRRQASVLLAAYEREGYKLSRQERRRLQNLAFGDTLEEANNIKDNRMKTVFRGERKAEKQLTAAEIDGRERLREMNTPWWER